MGDDPSPDLIRDLYQAARRLGVSKRAVEEWLTAPTTWWGGPDAPLDHLDEPGEVLRAFESHYGVEW